MRKLIHAVALLLLLGGAASATTRTSASCNLGNGSDGNVLQLVNQSISGDTVNIPAGSCTWSSTLNVPGGVTIMGAGTRNTSISTFGASASCSTGTTITLAGIVGFWFRPTFGNATTQLSCMTIQRSGNAVSWVVQGTCLAGGCPNVRIDNLNYPATWGNNLYPGNGYGYATIGNALGVIDHNSVRGNGQVNVYNQFVEFGLSKYLGVGDFGDYVWSLPEMYGTDKFLFIENNAFTAVGPTENEHGLFGFGGQGGGRVVVRYNHFINMTNETTELAWHGTESTGRPRSARAFEFYKNTYNTLVDGVNNVASIRGGTGFFWGNTSTLPTTSQPNGGFVLGTYRTQGMTHGFGNWGSCDGSRAWDKNDEITYYSGTITAASGPGSGFGGVTVTVTPNLNWTPDGSGDPYSMHDDQWDNGSEITSVGTNTISMWIAGGPCGYGIDLCGGYPLVTGSGGNSTIIGHTVKVLRSRRCIDAAGGAGMGTLYDSSQTPPNLPAANQVVSPVYGWQNHTNVLPRFSNTMVSATNLHVHANRDYFTDNLTADPSGGYGQLAQTSNSSPFNGSSGVGYGTLANRPSTCTGGTSGAPGVGYFATNDGPIWNAATGEQGRLYVCVNGSWSSTAIPYTPFPYPHTLISGAPQLVSPTVSITSPANGGTVSGSPTIIATASTTDGTIAGVSFSYIPSAGGATVPIGAEDTTSPYSVTWDTTTLQNGGYTLTATARGSNGASNSATSGVTVSNNQTLFSMTTACVSPCNGTGQPNPGIDQTLTSGGSTGAVAAFCFDTAGVRMNCATASPLPVFQSSDTSIATVTAGAACGTQDWCGTVTPGQAGQSTITAVSGSVTSTGMTVTVTPAGSTPLLHRTAGSRYLLDPSNNAVLLAGDHTWNDVQRISDQTYGTINAYSNFAGYLQWMKDFGHNYIRFWELETATGSESDAVRQHSPVAYARCGFEGAAACTPGATNGALDGGNKFDLNTFSPAYFTNLSDRVTLAKNAGFYVSVMFYDAWSEFDGTEYPGVNIGHNAWWGHPYNYFNNMNDFVGDVLNTNDGWGMNGVGPSSVGTSLTLWNREKAYVHKVVDTVHGFDNVIYEVTNEPTYPWPNNNNGLVTTQDQRTATVLAWQSAIADEIAAYETAQGYSHHPVIVEAVTPTATTNAAIITIRDETLPPPIPSTSAKVLFYDTDHFADNGSANSYTYVWERFVRGAGMLGLMDDPGGVVFPSLTDSIRRAYGDVRSYSLRMNLATTAPWDNTSAHGGAGNCTTALCLVDPGRTYLMFYPSGTTSANLTVSGVSAGGCEWFNVITNARSTAGCTFQQNGTHTYTVPTTPAGPWVLFVGGSGPTIDTTNPTASFIAPTPTAGSNVEGTFTMTVSASDNVAVRDVTFTVDGVTTAVVGAAPYTFTATTLSYNANDPVCADTTYTKCANHVLSCFATDTSGLQGACTPRTVQFVTTPPPPEGTPGGPSTIKGSIMMGGRVK